MMFLCFSTACERKHMDPYLGEEIISMRELTEAETYTDEKDPFNEPFCKYCDCWVTEIKNG